MCYVVILRTMRLVEGLGMLWEMHFMANCPKTCRKYSRICSTLWTVEHAEAVGVVMTEELALNNRAVLLNEVDIALIKLFSEPGLISLLLKHPWRDVADNVNLEKQNKESLYAIMTQYMDKGPNWKFSFLLYIVTFSLFLVASWSTFSAQLNWSAGSLMFSVRLFWL